MSKLKSMITLALVALGITAFTSNAHAEGKTYGIDAGSYVYPHPSDTNPGDEHGSWYSHYVMKQADAKAAMSTTETVTYQDVADWLGADFAAHKASVIANAEKIDFDSYEDQYFFYKDGSEEAGVGDAIGVFFYDDGANRAYNVMSNNNLVDFHFDDEYIGTSSDWTTPTPELPPVPIEAKLVAVDNTDAAVYTNGYLSAEIPGSSGYWYAWSNQTATVVYTAKPGYAFEGGTTAETVPLDTRVNPAVLAGDAPGPVVKISLVLGVIAQRFPWNGIVDVNYNTTNWPKTGAFGAVEITCGDTVVTNKLEITGSGEGVQTVDLKSLFGEAAGKAQFKAIVGNQPVVEK